MNVFLTGGTGFLGEYLLAELLNRGHYVWVLYRTESKRLETIRFLGSLGLPRNAHHLKWIPGDLLELDKQWRDLCRNHPGMDRIDTLLHSAASTRFYLDRFGDPLRTNLDGSKAMVGLAERIPLQVHIVSTAYVCGLKHGDRIPEINHPRGDFVNVYEESKWEAEQLWQGRATILRPSVIVGHSVTGRCSSFMGWYILFQAVDLLDRLMRDDHDSNRLNIDIHLPADPQSAINIVPVDYVAAAAVAIIEEPGNHNKIFHLTHPDPPNHQWTMDAVCKRFNMGGFYLSGAGTPMSEPRNPKERMVWRQMKTILPHFSNNPVFDRTNTDRAVPHIRVPEITGSMVNRLIDYAIAKGWGQPSG